ncbi:serine hydrolase domain-containing protein [Pseudonocardia sediminis]|nr:serine hydrolase [Pseudonocardia sediminis]
MRRRVPGGRLARAGVVVALLAGSLGVAAVSANAAPAAPADGCEITRTGEYPRAEAAQQGLDPARLQDALNYASVMGSHTIKVFRHSCLVGEGLRDPLLERVVDDTWGNTKTIVSLLTGIASDRGAVDLDAPISEHLPADLGDAAHRAVTLRQLLHATSGAEVNQVRGLNFVADDSRMRDWFAQPITHEPGSYYFYDQTATSVIVYVTQRAISEQAGRAVDYQEFAQSALFDRLGVPRSAYFWQRDRTGLTSGYSQLFLRPLEFGRFGELILRDGAFQGEQVVSQDYMREFDDGTEANCGYSVLTFVNNCEPGEQRVGVGVPEREVDDGRAWVASAPADMIFTDGVGTRIFVIPSLDMVVTRNGEQELDLLPSVARGDVNNAVPGRPGAAGTHEFFRRLMAAVTDMPDDVRATIENSGPYDGPPRVGFDVTQYTNQPTAPVETTSGLGLPPGDCGPAGCAGEPNDGVQRLVTDAPRVVPGTVGAETRPDGGSEG